MADLQKIFDALVPGNVKNIPLLKTASTIFLTQLQESSAVSWDIQEIYNYNLDHDTNMITYNSKLNLRKSLLNTYLKSTYDIIKVAQTDKALQDKLTIMGINGTASINNPAETLLGIDYFATGKTFKQTIGTVNGINSANALAAELERNVNHNPPVVTEVKPFLYNVESSISGEMYYNIVDKLAHPIGFAYTYKHIIEEALIDYFGLVRTYNVNAIEVRGSKGTYDVFVQNTTDAYQVVLADFLTRTNFLSGNLFTQAEFDAQVTIWGGKIVQSITEETLSTGYTIDIQFTDGTFLLQTPNYNSGVSITYANYNTWVNNHNSFIKDFTPNNTGGHYSLFTDFNVSNSFSYTDNIEQFIVSLDITNVNDSTGNAGGHFYLDSTGTQVPSRTSDNYVVSSTNFVTETFNMINPLVNGIYFYTTDNVYLGANIGSTDYFVAQNI